MGKKTVTIQYTVNDDKPLSWAQKKYLKFVREVYNDHLCDITRTIVWMNFHYQRMPPDVRSAYRELSSEERNEVIVAVCESKKDSPGLDYFDDYHAPRGRAL